MRYCWIYLFYFIFFPGLIYCQNFRYNPEDWYILKRPGSINAISEDNYNVYFAADNGVFRYNKSAEDYTYDYSFSVELDFPEIRHMIYDSFRDYFWIVHSKGISFKSSISSIWRDISFSDFGIFSYYEIDDIGVSPDFIWIRSINELHPFDPFSSKSANWNDAKEDIDFIKWGFSQFGKAGETVDISPYSIDDKWSIGLKNISHKDGREMNAIVYMEDDEGNLWFGTNEGYILKGWKYSSRLEVITIGLPFDHVTTAYYDQVGNWWFADNHFKRTGNFSSIRESYNMQYIPFISQWNELENLWTHYTPEESILIQNTDINSILRVGSVMYFSTMNGLLYLDLFNQEWNIINTTHGLYDSAVWDMIERKGSIYLATANGINEISIANHNVVPDTEKRFEILSKSSIYHMVADSEFLYLATNHGLGKMSWKDGEIVNLSKKIFHKIKFTEEGVFGTDENLWFINDDVEEKYIISNIHDFDICGSYIWASKRDNIILFDLVDSWQWEYGLIDGIPGEKIYGINCDEDWVWFLTNQGVAFYNWGNYHNKKN